MARDCDQPPNLDNVVCRNCEKTGHFRRDCPEPTDCTLWNGSCETLGHRLTDLSQGARYSAPTARNTVTPRFDARKRRQRSLATTPSATISPLLFMRNGPLGDRTPEDGELEAVLPSRLTRLLLLLEDGNMTCVTNGCMDAIHIVLRMFSSRLWDYYSRWMFK